MKVHALQSSLLLLMEEDGLKTSQCEAAWLRAVHHRLHSVCARHCSSVRPPQP